MLFLAALLAFAPGAAPDRLDFQMMISPAFATMASKAEASCPARKLRYLHPADLDGIEEDFIPSLRRPDQHRIAAYKPSDRKCLIAGISCPAQHTLTAISKAGLLDAFVQFACASAI